jgi:hypothetical protein
MAIITAILRRLCPLTLIAWAASLPAVAQAVDLLLLNAQVVTMNDKLPKAEAVAIPSRACMRP